MGLSTEDRIEQLSLGISAVRVRLNKFNQCHVKSGPQGGQFCETKGGGGSSGGGAKPVETAASSGDRIVARYSGITVGVDPPSPSAGEKDAMNSYKGMGYTAINQTLLGNPHSIPHFRKVFQDRVDNLSNMVNRSTLDTPATLYRGMGGKPAKSLSSLPVGSEFSIPVFQSTSTSLKVAAGFADRSSPPQIVFKIHAPTGTKALPIDKFEKKISGGERELVLNRNLKYRVTGREEVDGRVVMSMEVVK